MRKIGMIGSTALFLMSANGWSADNKLQHEARTTAMTLGKALKSEVVKSMKAMGPVGTIGFCNYKAPEITNQVASKSGWHVARTSLKYRNPKNAPDSWELAVLEKFEARKASGEPVKNLEFGEIVTLNGKQTYRYMKAIPTGKPCLHCHAAKIRPEVESMLQRLYPGDKARGFKVGDIRGAFTLSKNL